VIVVFLVSSLTGCRKEGILKPHLPENYIFVSQWGTKGSGKGQFGWIYGITMGLNDNIYVMDRDIAQRDVSNRLQCFTSGGEFIKQWGADGEGPFYNIEGITVDFLNGNIYIVDSTDRIQEFTSDEKFVKQWEVKFLQGVAVDSANKCLYAITSYHNFNKYDLSGKFITSCCPFPWISPAEGRPPSYSIRALAVNSKHNIIVLYCNSSRRFEIQNGSYVQTGWDREFIIMEFAPDGYILKVLWNSQVKKIEENPGFGSIALDKEDNIYMTDYENNCVWKFSPDWDLLARWGSSGSGEGQFYTPNGIAIDSEGNVYVSDAKNNRIQKFKLDYNYKN